MIKVAIVGNPNVGKTELFNRLTGLNQHVGNWPGVTVEKKEGRYRFNNEEVEVVDLPGIYGLVAESIDEKIAKDYIFKEKPDVVVNIVNSTNLARNLYLTLMLIESGANVVVALNMWDLARREGISIDIKKLENLLGVPVVATVATTGEGIQKLKETIYEIALGKRKIKSRYPDYGKSIEEKLKEIERIVEKDPDFKTHPPRWISVRILEGDKDVLRDIRKKKYWEQIKRYIDESSSDKISRKRHEICLKIERETVVKLKEKEETFTSLLDEVFLHKIFGLPIFFTLLYAIFQFTFSFSTPFSDMISMFFSWLGNLAKANIENEIIASFVANGICSGLGSVLVFVPPIFCLFFVLSIFENSGYMARAAFIMERFLSKFGLHGKSFIPMLVGIGCNVPGIMSARTVEDESDRIITIMVNPLMSCSARLPVYILIAGSIFHGYAAGAAVYSMYIIGLSLAMVIAFALRKILFKGKVTPFIMELPKYTMPSIRSSLLHMWNRGKWFIVKAGTFIFLVVIVIWFLLAFPWEATNGGEIIENSYIALFGKRIEFIFKPLGWNWQAGTALFFGLLAKESIVGAIGAMLTSGGENAYAALANAGWFTPLTGFAYMAFVLIYFPCIATLSVMLREVKVKYTLLTVFYTIMLAFVVAFMIEILGRLIGLS